MRPRITTFPTFGNYSTPAFSSPSMSKRIIASPRNATMMNRGFSHAHQLFVGAAANYICFCNRIVLFDQLSMRNLMFSSNRAFCSVAYAGLFNPLIGSLWTKYQKPFRDINCEHHGFHLSRYFKNLLYIDFG